MDEKRRELFLGKTKYFIVLAIIYKILTDWSYIILSHSSFQNQFFLNLSIVKLIISYIMVGVISYVLCKSRDVPGFFLKLLFYSTIIPISTVFSLSSNDELFFAFVIVSFFTSIYLYQHVTFKFGKFLFNKKISLNDLSNSYTIKYYTKLDVISLAASILLIVIMYFNNGIPSLTAIDFSKVYDIRSNFNSTSYINYLLSVVSGILIPFGLATSMRDRKIYLRIAYTIIGFMLYLWTGNKIYLFSLVLVYFTYFIYNNGFSQVSVFFTIDVCALIGCITSYKDPSNFSFIFSYFNRRMILDSATLKYFYYDYFINQSNSLTYFQGTILAPIFKYRIADDFRLIISEVYTGFISSANTGIYGGDLASFGLLSFMIVTIFLYVLLVLVNIMEKKAGTCFTLVFFVYIFYRLNEICLITFFLDFTGIALVFLVLFYNTKFTTTFKTTLPYRLRTR